MFLIKSNCPTLVKPSYQILKPINKQITNFNTFGSPKYDSNNRKKNLKESKIQQRCYFHENQNQQTHSKSVFEPDLEFFKSNNSNNNNKIYNVTKLKKHGSHVCKNETSNSFEIDQSNKFI